MLNRLLFALRRSGLDGAHGLGSWRLSIVLMLLVGLYYVLLAVWATSSPPHVVQNIASLLPFWLLYGLLLVNTLFCLWSRMNLLRRQISAQPYLAQGPPDWETESPCHQSEAVRLFRDCGYRPQLLDQGHLWGVRRRWSALGTYLFHGALILVAGGFVLSIMGRYEASVWVAVGEDFSAQREQFLSQSPPKIFSVGAPALSFRVESIRPEFWRDELLFTTLEADLVTLDGRRTATRINRPLWWDWCTFVRLSGFGYAPRYAITDEAGRALDSAFVKLNVFPPGQRDFFKIPNYPHRFYVEVLPDFTVVEGEPFTRSLNLINPAVVLRVLRGKVDLGAAVLESGGGFGFEGLAISFPEIRYWGEFSIVRDPGAPVVFLGYLLGVLGLLLKMVGRRSELSWQAGPEGLGTLRGWATDKPGGRRL